MHPSTTTHIVNDRISTLHRDGARERLAAQTRQASVTHRRSTAEPAGLRGWLRIVLRGAA
jgi:hypothetical protein